jgi:hypothetical protein
MSESKIRRKNKAFTVTLDAAVSNATEIVLADMAGGMVSIGTQNTNATELAVHVASASAGTYRPLYAADGSAVKITLAPSTADSRVYAMPDEVFAAPFIKLVLNNTAANGLSAIILAKG